MSEEVVTMAGADAMRERIAAHPWPRGGVAVIRANRGYTLYSRRTSGPVARLRPTGKADTVQGPQGGHRPGPARGTPSRSGKADTVQVRQGGLRPGPARRTPSRSGKADTVQVRQGGHRPGPARRTPSRSGKADTVQVLWWRREAWAPPGDFGPLILPLNQALDFVAPEGCFWINA